MIVGLTVLSSVLFLDDFLVCTKDWSWMKAEDACRILKTSISDEVSAAIDLLIFRVILFASVGTVGVISTRLGPEVSRISG